MILIKSCLRYSKISNIMWINQYSKRNDLPFELRGSRKVEGLINYQIEINSISSWKDFFVPKIVNKKIAVHVLEKMKNDYFWQIVDFWTVNQFKNFKFFFGGLKSRIRGKNWVVIKFDKTLKKLRRTFFFIFKMRVW